MAHYLTYNAYFTVAANIKAVIKFAASSCMTDVVCDQTKSKWI